jgi:hypothetical protein
VCVYIIQTAVSRALADAMRAETLAATDGADVSLPPPPARAQPATPSHAPNAHFAPRASPLRGRAPSIAGGSARAATAAAAGGAEAAALAWLDNASSRAELRATVAASAAVAPVPIGWLLRCALLLGLSLPGDEHLMWMAEALWASRRVPFGWIERPLPSDGAAHRPDSPPRTDLPEVYYESPLEGSAHWLHPVHLRLRAAARAQKRAEHLERAVAQHDSGGRRGSRFGLAMSVAALRGGVGVSQQLGVSLPPPTPRN